jgi:Glycosyltransferase family 87
VRRAAGLLATLVALATPAASAAAVGKLRASAIASRLPVVRAQLRSHPDAYPSVSSPAAGEWAVGYYTRTSEIVEVLVAKADGRVLGAYTGFKIAWTMARGTPGAFGGLLDALWAWLPLCALFLVPFFDWRRPACVANLDLLALLSFSVSFAFFNHGDIYASVPLVYPPLLYLLGRMLWLARRRAPPSTLRLNVPLRWLAVAGVVLVGLRVGYDIAGSSVIDVGYANVVGAQRLLSGVSLYGSFPSSIARGDTYGPASYEAYAPFVWIFGRAPRWNGLPAAHAAAIAFELIALALLFAIGRRIRGPGLGVALAYAWAAYPFTALVLESNTNDALVADLVLAALLAARCAPWRGALAALAALTKFAPLALAPLLLTQRLRQTRWRGLLAFAGAFVLAGAIATEPALAHDAIATIYRRTVGYQASRMTPFSPWGLYGGLRGWQVAVQIAAIALALALALAPRREDVVGLAAAAAAVLIAVQLGAGYWFYLYIPWFFAPAAVALLGRHEQLLDRLGAKRRRAGH